MSRNSNTLIIEGSRKFLNNLKFEIASELGIPNYDQMDKGSLPSRVNGYIGGNMTKRLVALGEAAMSSQDPNAINMMRNVPLDKPNTN